MEYAKKGAVINFNAAITIAKVTATTTSIEYCYECLTYP